MRNLVFGIIFLASLSFKIGFAITPQECDNLLKDTTNNIDPRKIGSLTTQQIIDCASASAAKTHVLSPLDIFQLIINAVAALAFGLGVLALIISALQMATSAGDKDKFKFRTSLVLTLFFLALQALHIAYNDYDRSNPFIPVFALSYLISLGVIYKIDKK